VPCDMHIHRFGGFCICPACTADLSLLNEPPFTGATSGIPRKSNSILPITSTWPNHLRTRKAHLDLEFADCRTTRATPRHISNGALESKSACPGLNMSHRSSRRSWNILERARHMAYQRLCWYSYHQIKVWLFNPKNGSMF
jgi:hypothetical protein